MAEYDEYKVQRVTLVGIADQARRLGNATGELSPEQIKQVLSQVVLGGGTPEKPVMCLNFSSIPIQIKIHSVKF